MEYCLIEKTSEEDKEILVQGLTKYNIPFWEQEMFQGLSILARDNGELIGGIICRTIGAWLEIEYLWINETNRRMGIGSKLLAVAEKEALVRGCTKASVYTYSFQAPQFYSKHGYKKVFMLNDYPNESSKVYFTKLLIAEK